MTRLIERWFPCAEVTANSDSGWGSGNVERNLFTWFAARPSAQARAAVICSLLPWPDAEPEQQRLQTLVRSAMAERYGAWDELRSELDQVDPDGARILDPFSGRGMIPLEAARFGVQADAFDYSPVAVLASELLVDYLFRDWSAEPPLPFDGFADGDQKALEAIGADRLAHDVELVLAEIGRRQYAEMADHYPTVNGKDPWGYLWAVTLPCQECGRYFPVVGSYDLRQPRTRKATKNRPESKDPGQSFYVEGDVATGVFRVVVHNGTPKEQPTLVNAVDVSGRKIPGKAARCCFCGHTHPLNIHRRLTNDGLGIDRLLLVGDLDPDYGKVFREPTTAEVEVAEGAAAALAEEKPFSPFLPAVPNELIAPGNNNIIGPSIYGARTYGDLMCARQTLAFVRLCRIIEGLGEELPRDHGLSPDYTKALVGYAVSTLVRKLRYSTRGAWLHFTGSPRIAGIFINEGSLAFSYDFFETGIAAGPSTWASVSASTVSVVTGLLPERPGRPVSVMRATATDLPLRAGSVTAVVTDPPYDEMVAYADSSDIFFCWAKRALNSVAPEFALAADETGSQSKTEEIIVKRVRGDAPDEHRTREHYDTKIAQAFREMRRVVESDGLVTIVFGHGEPEVWQRLLNALQAADLVMTASWPARTESGGRQGKANIQTTLTMACRPASSGRPEGRRASVESEIREEIRARYPDWERWELAPTDMLMAAAGPAMEVVGRYARVLDARGEAVDISMFLPLARAAVQEAMAVEIDNHPLETFDARTRFALWWVRLFGKSITPKSELRWQALAASMDLADVRDLVPDTEKGCAFTSATKHAGRITPDSSIIDVVLGLSGASDAGLEAMGEVLLAAARQADDAYLWAATKFLADRLPEGDADALALTRVLRSRGALSNVVRTMEATEQLAAEERTAEDAQMKLL